MTANLRNTSQFSLRTLFLLVLVSSALFGVWRAFGVTYLFVSVFGILSAIPLATLNNAWKLAYALSWSATYGPFVVMSVYTQLYVSCTHCKSTVWNLLPIAPGLVLGELARHFVEFPRPPELLSVVLAVLASVTFMFALAWLIRSRSWRWSVPAVGAIVTGSSFAAIALLAAIRA